MAAVSKGMPRRAPVTRRGRAVVEAILEATRQLLAHHSIDSIDSNKIAERAGVSVGSFYRYYPNKHAVLAHLARDIEEHSAALVEERVGRLAPGDVAGLVETLIGVLVDRSVGEDRMRREIRLSVPPLWFREVSAAVDARVLQITATFLRRNARKLRGDIEPQIAAYMLLRAGEAIVESALADGQAGLDRATIERELFRLAMRYLMPAPPSSPSSSLPGSRRPIP